MEHRLNSPAVGALRAQDRGILDRIVARLAGAWHAWRHARERDAVRRSLAGLSDATLRDLGLRRCELGSVAAEVVGEAGSTRLRVRIGERGAKP